MKKFKSLLISLVLTLTCISMVTSPNFVQAASIKLNKTSLTIYTGKTSTLKVIGTSKKVTWSTSNKNVATVSSKGTVSAKSPGKATITARISNKNLKCNVTVKEKTTPKKAAQKAYYNFLKSYKFNTTDPSYHGFNLAYINNDSIPELLVFDGNHHSAGVNVYAYVNRKVKYVGNFGAYDEFTYQEKKGIIRSYYANQGHYLKDYYKWNGSKLSTIMTSHKIEVLRPNGNIGYDYYINNKKVTYSKYKSSIAPYEKYLKRVNLSNSHPVTDSVMRKILLY